MRRWGLRGVWAIALAFASAPAWASTCQLGAIRFDEASQTLFLETSGSPIVSVKRERAPDRLVIDLADAAWRGGPQTVPLPGREILGYRTVSTPGAPEGARVILELQPGVEPMVAIRQLAGRVAVTLGEAPLPKGERDLETLPPTDLWGATFSVEPSPTPTPTPSPLVLPVASAPASPEPPLATASSRPVEPPWPVTEAPSVITEELRSRTDFGSTLLLRWQQLETLETYGAGPAIFAYPTGLNGVEWRHWWGPYLGFGLEGRILNYDEATAGTRQNRTDLMLLPELAARMPLLGGRLEPEVTVGYMARQVNVLSSQSGSGAAFAPTQFHYGPMVGTGLRMRLLPSLSLGLGLQYLPVVGGNLYHNFGDQSFGNIFFLSTWRYQADLMVDIARAYLLFGYGDETTHSDRQYQAVFSGLRGGVGWRY